MADQNAEKLLKVNSSSIVDLKAELFRKQAEFQKEKLQGINAVKGKTIEKKPNIWSKKNKGVLERAQQDMETKREEQQTFDKSRSILEAKAKLYDKMTRQGLHPTNEEDEKDSRFLVDFEQKAVDAIIEKREEIKQRKHTEKRGEQEKREMEEEKLALKETVPESENPDDKWVEYVDTLGRTRKCLQKDLSHFMKMDKSLKPTSSLSITEPGLLSEDMRRELLRQKWEQEQEEQLNKPVGPIHYADVQYDEVHSHGVSYYQFSKEELERQEQMKILGGLREQTKEQREKREKLKEKRKNILAARLAKVRQRKGIKEPEPEPEEDISGPKVSEQDTKPDFLVRENKAASSTVREWDIGKTEDLAGQWVHKQRNERLDEFAPPSFYNDKQNNPDRKRALPTHSQPQCQQSQQSQPHVDLGSSEDFYPSKYPKKREEELPAYFQNVANAATKKAHEVKQASLEKPGMNCDISSIPLPADLPNQDTGLPMTLPAPPLHTPPIIQFDPRVPPPPFRPINKGSAGSHYDSSCVGNIDSTLKYFKEKSANN